MKKAFSKLWLVALLAVGVFASCSKDDRTEPNSPAEQTGEAVTLSLSAEVGFEEEAGDLKGLNFKLEALDGKRIPRPQFNDGAPVDVVTVIKSQPTSGSGVTYARKMTWKYSAATKRLVLSRTSAGNSIAIPGFNNDGNTKWYIAGLLAPGATLSGTNNTEVKFQGTSVLKGVSGNVGDDLGSMNIPYWTEWMELFIETSSGRDSDNSYSNASVQTTGAKFKPLGSLIAFRLGNKLENVGTGTPSFTPTGFTVASNAYADKGTFDLATTGLTDDLPKWTATTASMAYTFASGYTAPPINHNVAGGDSGRAYYAWVMPHATQPTAVKSRVMLRGMSSNFSGTSSKRYFTDYASSGKSPKQGKIHTLTANATRHLILPIDYVAEYNLAGGKGLTDTVPPGRNPGQLYSSPFNGVQPAGVQGPLRFANRTASNTDNTALAHRNDQSGYYNWFKLMGVEHTSSNNYNEGSHNPPPAKNISTQWFIDTDGKRIRLDSKYFIPELDHWWGVLPSYAPTTSPPSHNHVQWSGSNGGSRIERFQYGYSENRSDRKFFWGSSEYSAGAPDPNEPGNAVIYAIRFAAAGSRAVQNANFHGASVSQLHELVGSSYVPWSRLYRPLLDNHLRCAYRYTRVGLIRLGQGSGDDLEGHLRIDVVYLGDDPSVTTVADISNPDFWSSPDCTRIIPAAGSVSYNYKISGITYGQSPDRLDSRGYRVWYRSATSSSFEYTKNTYQVYSYFTEFRSSNSYHGWEGFPVRLFKREP